MNPVNTITFIDENRRFVTTSDDKSIRVWEWDIPVDFKYIADPGDYKKIISEIYDTPFTLYNQDNTKVMKTEAEVEKFLVETFKSLEEKNYGHSIINGWVSFKKDRDIILIEMNFTRFLKNGKVMGEDERTASYIIRKKDKSFRILAIIPHTTVAE